MNTNDMDLGEVIDLYMTQEQMYYMEGPTGVKRLTKLTKNMDSSYNTLEAFLMDNSGAIEAIVEWIKSQNIPEWKEKLVYEIG